MQILTMKMKMTSWRRSRISFEPIKMDLKVQSIVDNSKYDNKKQESAQTRKVTIGTSDGSIKVVISGKLEDHPLKKLNKKSDINMDSSIILKVGSGFQKRLDEIIQ